MISFLCKNAHDILKQKLIEITSEHIDPYKEEHVFFFDLVSTKIFNGKDCNDVNITYSLLYPMHIVNKCVIVSYDFMLFNNNWTKVFLLKCMNTITENGLFIIIMPNTTNDNSVEYLNPDIIIKLFNLQQNQYVLLQHGNFFIMKITKKTHGLLPSIPSVLEFHYDNLQDILNMADTLCVHETLDLGAMNYFTYGSNYKSVMIKAFIKMFLDKSKKNISLLDMGGAAGFIPSELYLENIINNVTIVDNTFVYELIYNRLREYLAKFGFTEINFVNKPMESYEYTRNFDVICFIGSLLYINRSMVDHTLKMAWEHLNKNGIMIIHENIKHVNYVRDFNYMFTYDEIEKRLACFGETHYFKNNNLLPINMANEKNKDITLFRVLQKKN